MPNLCVSLHSDIDVVVIGAPSESNNQMALLQLADRLHARGETTMHVIPTAKVRYLTSFVWLVSRSPNRVILIRTAVA